jgi:hypothetical protein
VKESRFNLLIVFLTCFVFVLAGCATPTQSFLESELPTLTSRPTFTQTLTYTPNPTFTPFPTQTLAPSPTQTSTPYAGMDFSQASILWGGFLPHWQYFVAIELPGPATSDFYAIVDYNKEYTCEVHVEFPNRLYCYGPQVRMADWAFIALYVKGNDNPVFEDRFFTPLKYEFDHDQ